MTKAIRNLPETPANTHRVTLQDYVLQAPCEVGLAICNALLMAIPMRGKGTGKGLNAARGRVREWNIFTRQIDGLRSVVHTVAARIQEGKTGPVPSVDWEVGHLHTVSPKDFANLGGDGVCDLWPSHGVWLSTACQTRAGRGVVTPASRMDADFWAVYIVHSIKSMLLGSVWPAMACGSQYMLRGFVNDLETSSFWLAVDAETLELGKAGGDAKPYTGDTEATWKGRLVWTIKTNELHHDISGDTLWRRGRLRVLTSAPRTQAGHVTHQV